MRRKDKAITDTSHILGILNKALYCHIAFSHNERPYMVPMNFGYDSDDKTTVYFHSASEGLKIDMLGKNPHVFLNFIADAEITPDENPCKWGMRYSSVSASGIAEIITDHSDKIKALQCIMRHYCDMNYSVFDEKSVENCIVFKVIVETISGKAGG